MVDYNIIIISRWRMSNQKIRIEFGRDARPSLREERICTNCDVLEDEYHVIFPCPTLAYRNMLDKYCTIQSLLNPTFDNADIIVQVLIDIDDKLIESR